MNINKTFILSTILLFFTFNSAISQETNSAEYELTSSFWNDLIKHFENQSLNEIQSGYQIIHEKWLKGDVRKNEIDNGNSFFEKLSLRAMNHNWEEIIRSNENNENKFISVSYEMAILAIGVKLAQSDALNFEKFILTLSPRKRENKIIQTSWQELLQDLSREEDEKMANSILKRSDVKEYFLNMIKTKSYFSKQVDLMVLVGVSNSLPLILDMKKDSVYTEDLLQEIDLNLFNFENSVSLKHQSEIQCAFIDIYAQLSSPEEFIEWTKKIQRDERSTHDARKRIEFFMQR